MKAGFKRADGKDIEIDIAKRQDLLTLYQNYQNSLNLVDEDLPMITKFYTDITNDPFNIQIKKDLIDALGTDINDSTFRTLLAYQQNAIANYNSPYLKHDDFVTLTKDLDEMLTEYGTGTIDKATAIQGLRALREHAYNYLAANPNATKEQFDTEMQRKADKILVAALKPSKIDKIVQKREAFGTEGTLLQELKKITDVYSGVDRVAIFEIMELQDELHKQFFKLETISSDEYMKKMNELNNQILEITTKYNDAN